MYYDILWHGSKKPEDYWGELSELITEIWNNSEQEIAEGKNVRSAKECLALLKRWEQKHRMDVQDMSEKQAAQLLLRYFGARRITART